MLLIGPIGIGRNNVESDDDTVALMDNGDCDGDAGCNVRITSAELSDGIAYSDQMLRLIH